MRRKKRVARSVSPATILAGMQIAFTVLKLLIVLIFLVKFLRRPSVVWGIGLLTVTTAVLLDTLLGTFDRDALLAEYVAWNRQRARANHISPSAIDRYEAANPLFMSVDGILRYLRKRGAV